MKSHDMRVSTVTVRDAQIRVITRYLASFDNCITTIQRGSVKEHFGQCPIERAEAQHNAAVKRVRRSGFLVLQGGGDTSVQVPMNYEAMPDEKLRQHAGVPKRKRLKTLIVALSTGTVTVDVSDIDVNTGDGLLEAYRRAETLQGSRT